MASRKAALMALLVATLLSSLLVQGALDRREVHCCYCDCLNNKRCTLMKGIAQLQCQWFCFNIKCAFKCNDTRYNRCMHDLGSRCEFSSPYVSVSFTVLLPGPSRVHF
jgi:hypothetical protein